MDGIFSYQLIANAVLSLHVALVAFVVGGLVLVISGNLLAWRWVNSFWFRLSHLVAIATVAAESWFGVLCPLTTLEMWLRAKAKSPTYAGTFIEHWLQFVLYYQAPSWVFTASYSLFGLAVAAAWWHFPPRRNPRRNRAREDSAPATLQGR
jgi:hypothetical protein